MWRALVPYPSVQLIDVGPSYAWGISDLPRLLNRQRKSSACAGELAEMIRTSKIISPLIDSKASDWYPCWHHPQSLIQAVTSAVRDSGVQGGMSEEMLSELSLERWPEIRTEE